jgi:hypothetical protein
MVVIQFGYRSRLAFKTGRGLFTLGSFGNRSQIAANNFNGHLPSNAGMLSQINIPHATTFDEPLQTIPTEGFPHQHIHRISPLSKNLVEL